MADIKIVTSNDCTQCEHEKVCRHREDYLGFVNAIDVFSEKCSGDKICEGVASIKISCNYFVKHI